MKKLHNKIPPPIIAIFIVLIMWFTHNYFPLMTFDFFVFKNIAYLFILAGLILDVKSFLSFRKNKTTVSPLSPQKTSYLVINGFYRYTRNPMYLGMLFILIGSAILFESLSAFLILPLFILVINALQIKPEEKILSSFFGDEYLDYKKKVKRWL